MELAAWQSWWFAWTGCTEPVHRVAQAAAQQVVLHAAACQAVGKPLHTPVVASKAARDGLVAWHRVTNQRRHEVGQAALKAAQQHGEGNTLSTAVAVPVLVEQAGSPTVKGTVEKDAKEAPQHFEEVTIEEDTACKARLLADELEKAFSGTAKK